MRGQATPETREMAERQAPRDALVLRMARAMSRADGNRAQGSRYERLARAALLAVEQVQGEA